MIHENAVDVECCVSKLCLAIGKRFLAGEIVTGESGQILIACILRAGECISYRELTARWFFPEDCVTQGNE